MSVKTVPVELIPVLMCEQCHKRVIGDSGFLVVDAVEAARRQHEISAYLTIETARSMKVPTRVDWHVWHSACAPHVTAMTNPYFRVWASRFATTNDLLAAMAELANHPWFAGTNWGGLARRILSDTGRHADQKKNVGRKKRRNGENAIALYSTKPEGAEHDQPIE